ncbi:MAG: hypothetical protein KFB96_06385 [Thiocapsa sp.]|uniref:hypothetical protein n=1 Tax=Thiocapsa sp. TaxID=2024551 RepID=UPI001BCC20FB|nr:hypothetical protein [Thiocapsa sp.]QVL50090.1 MAG: hypothetical protein KFB96_06385 [Thiocapsa sp.]
MSTADVVFVLPGASAADIEQFRGLDVDRNWQCFVDGVSAWIVQTYLLLRDAGYPVSLVSDFSREALKVAHVVSLSRRSRPRGCFVVGVRADYPSNPWCAAHVVQNKTQAGKSAIWIPHWPQPGMIPRDPSRGSRVETIGYFGRDINHYTRLFHRPSGWFKVRHTLERICDNLGLRLVTRGPDCWNDYHDVDIVVGLRDLGSATYDTKPPTKLINAWLADAVFIGGNDSAYRQIGQGDLNYLVASTPCEVRSRLEWLCNNSDDYSRMILDGAESVTAYQRSSVQQAWIAALNTLRGIGS